MNWQKEIKELRLKMFLTQKEFAVLLGVSFQTVNRYENGKTEPTMRIKRIINDLIKKQEIEVK